MSATAISRYDFKKKIEEIRAVKGRGTELISLYIPPGKQISDVSAYLRNEHSQSSNIKSRTTRNHVQGALESLLSRVRLYKTPPENGVVFFVGHKAISGDRTEMTQFIIEPPEPFTTFYYRCDSQFFLDPLLDMLEDKEEYGLLVIDQGEATIGFLKGKRIEVVKNVPSLVPRKHGRGGQSQRRFERLHDIAVHEFFKKIADITTEAFLDRKNMKGLLIGGPARITANHFLNGDYLHHEIRKKVVDVFDVGYTDESGLRELVDNAAGKLGEIALTKEKDLMNRFLQEIRKTDGGLGAYGINQVVKALEMGAVDTLLISEEIKKDRIVATCSRCKKELVMYIEPGTELSCPDCEEQLTIEEGQDIIKYLLNKANEFGTNIELISIDTDQGSMLIRAFGGLAAILRYRFQ
jgi:peptide chain release factor subunit 1